MVANHPFGGVEGIILSEVLLQARLDVRILGNYLLAFNVDKAFADVIDGLIWVDLLKTKAKIVERFPGSDGAMGFYRFHNPASVFKVA